MTDKREIGKGGDQVHLNHSVKHSETLGQDSDMGKEKHQELHQEIKATENQNTLSDPLKKISMQIYCIRKSGLPKLNEMNSLI